MAKKKIENKLPERRPVKITDDGKAVEYVLEVDVYFQDKYDKTKFYDVGDTLTITDKKRVDDIVSRGLGHIKK